MSLTPLELAAVTVAAAVVGAALGWWPLAAWMRRDLLTETIWPARGPGIRLGFALATGALWALIAWRISSTTALIVLVPLLAFAAAAVVLAVVDLAEKRLPNAVIVPALISIAILLVLTSAVTGLWWNLLWALAGSAGMFGLYLLIALIPGAMGMGDVKLAALIGLTLGWFGLSVWLVGLFAGCLIGGVAAIVALVLRAVRFKGTVPYGPSMLAGALVALLVLV